MGCDFAVNSPAVLTKSGKTRTFVALQDAGRAMPNSAVNVERLFAIGRSLGDVVIDPAIWPNILEQIGAAAGAAGAALLCSDIQTPDNPRTASADESFKHYFATGWHARNPLAQRGFPLVERGQKVISDQDIVTAEEMKCLDFYNEVLVPFGFQWFAGIGFAAGSALWGVTILRAPGQGPFEEQEKRILAWLSPRLSETATLSKAVGRTALLGVSNALHRLGHPALALDRLGFVLAANERAEDIFDDEFCARNRRLVVRDQGARTAFANLIDQLRTTADGEALPAAPIVVRRSAKRPLLIRVLPVDGAARTPFLGARALLIFSDPDKKSAPPSAVLSQTFRLSPAEARLASLIATGAPVALAAEQFGVSLDTIRTQLKAVYAKTGTRRQSELVALLSRLLALEG
jgi:DNA-binding CsgD family transcriptional regulator